MSVERLEPLRRDLVELSRLSGVTVPEVVRSIKDKMVSEGADLDICGDFFRDLEAIAALHIN